MLLSTCNISLINEIFGKLKGMMLEQRETQGAIPPLTNSSNMYSIFKKSDVIFLLEKH